MKNKFSIFAKYQGVQFATIFLKFKQNVKEKIIFREGSCGKTPR